MTEMDTARLAALAVGCVAGLVLGGLAAGLVLAAAYLRGRIRSSHNWQPTQGTVTASASRYHHGRGGRYHYPVVSYAYQVGGRTFTHDRIAFGVGPASAHATAEAAAARYAVGSPLTVYVNPRNPADAVLERRETSLTIYFIAGIVFILAATVPVCMVAAALIAMEGG